MCRDRVVVMFSCFVQNSRQRVLIPNYLWRWSILLHAVVSTKGCYTSPWKGTRHLVYGRSLCLTSVDPSSGATRTPGKM